MQAFKSESRALVWPHWKSSHSLRGDRGGQAEVAQAGTTLLHTEPHLISQSFTPFFWVFAAPPTPPPTTPLLVFPLLPVFLLLLKSPLLSPRAVRDHSAVPLRHCLWHSGLRTPCMTWRVLVQTWGRGGEIAAFFLPKLLQTWSLRKTSKVLSAPGGLVLEHSAFKKS